MFRRNFAFCIPEYLYEGPSLLLLAGPLDLGLVTEPSVSHRLRPQDGVASSVFLYFLVATRHHSCLVGHTGVQGFPETVSLLCKCICVTREGDRTVREEVLSVARSLGASRQAFAPSWQLDLTL